MRELDELKQMIDNEIKWCKENKDQKTPEFVAAFIKGLEQTKHLIDLKVEAETPIEDW